jgi:hypothetical protein
MGGKPMEYKLTHPENITRMMNWFEFKEHKTPTTIDQNAHLSMVTDENEPLAVDRYIDMKGLTEYSNDFYQRYIRSTPRAYRHRNQTTRSTPTTKNILLSRLMSSLNDVSDVSYRNILKAMFYAGALKYLNGNLSELVGSVDGRAFIAQFMKVFANPGNEIAVDDHIRVKLTAI